MSSAYYVVLERKIPGFDEQVNGKALASAGELLDALAQKAGVQSLMEFFSVVPEEVAGLFEGEGLDLVKLPSEKWSPCRGGSQDSARTPAGSGKRTELYIGCC